MKTIVIFNQKGGVGKTSTVSNLMAELSYKNKKVLGIDLDPQSNLSTFFGYASADLTVRDWLLLKADYGEVIKSTDSCGDIIPSNESLSVELLRFATIPAFVIKMRELIRQIPCDKYDFVLIDCPPAVNQLTAAALVAADYVIIPTEAEYFSADGVAKIAETISQVKPLNPDLTVLGVLLVKYNSRRVLTKAIEQKLSQSVNSLLDCGIFDIKIRFTVDVPAAQATGVSARKYKPTSKAAQDYAALADEIIESIG